jgi:hypothetical protein
LKKYNWVFKQLVIKSIISQTLAQIIYKNVSL